MNILYFLIMLIIICFYFIQNSQMIEHFHFEVSPERKLCMEQSVCQTVDSNGNCSTLNNPNLNSTNFPPRNSCDSCGASGCHSWTNGWNGNFPMNYNDWIDNANVKETKPCAPYYQVNSAHPPQLSAPWAQSTYAHLYNYNSPPQFNEKLLPVPGPYKQTRSTTDNVLQAGIASVKEGYTPPFLKCTSMQRKAPCQSVESYEPQYNIASLEIDFYGSQGCGWCKKAKDLLNKEGVLDKVTYKDASQHADELRSRGGGGGVPLFYSKKTGKVTVGYPGSITTLIEKLK